MMEKFQYEVGYFDWKNEKAEILAKFKEEKDADIYISVKQEHSLSLIYFVKVGRELKKMKSFCMKDYVSRLSECSIYVPSIDEENNISLENHCEYNSIILYLLDKNDEPEPDDSSVPVMNCKECTMTYGKGKEPCVYDGCIAEYDEVVKCREYVAEQERINNFERW